MSEDLKGGARDAVLIWLNEHEVSVPAIFEAAVASAVERWLDSNGSDLLRGLRDKVEVIDRLLCEEILIRQMGEGSGEGGPRTDQ